jgi:hypothetical protein
MGSPEHQTSFQIQRANVSVAPDVSFTISKTLAMSEQALRRCMTHNRDVPEANFDCDRQGNFNQNCRDYLVRQLLMPSSDRN